MHDPVHDVNANNIVKRRMRQARKDLFFGSLLVVLVGAGWFVFRSIGPADFGARVIGRTNDASGQLQIIYEVTNRTSKDIVFALASVATRSATGWRVVEKREQPEMHVSRMLARQSATAVRMITRPGDAAVRGQLQYQQDDSPLRRKMKMLARRAGLPLRLWASPGSVWGDAIPFGVIPLPEAETSGHPFLLATTADGVWPEPSFAPPLHNFSIRGNPAMVLDAYRTLSGAEVKVDPSVSLFGAKITVEPNHDIQEVSEGIRLIEDALREQAGIVITRRDSNRVTFTYNEGAKLKTQR